jgi:hypothetical protein
MQRTCSPDQLRYNAQLAYRDGRPMRARKLNSMADNLGSGLIDHSQNMTAAAMQIAEK